MDGADYSLKLLTRTAVETQAKIDYHISKQLPLPVSSCIAKL
jgi:hypothetical protein